MYTQEGFDLMVHSSAGGDDSTRQHLQVSKLIIMLRWLINDLTDLLSYNTVEGLT
jgi:hypothetical protein